MRWRRFFPLLLIAVAANLLRANPLRYRMAIISQLEKSQPGRNLEESAARRALQAMGIPYDLVPVSKLQSRYPVAILPGPLYNHSLSPVEREAVHAFVSNGGLLLATQVEGSDYFPLFGISSAVPRRDRFRVRFSSHVEDGWLRYLDHPKEREISLGDPKLFDEIIWTVGYQNRYGRALAEYPDGSAAAVVNDYDSGQALTLGFSLTQTVLLAHVVSTFEAGRQWANSFEPSGDAILLLIKGIYENTADYALCWHTVPRGLETSIVLSHDVDARESFGNTVAYAQLEKQYGVQSTFFINTKTFTDESDIGYYDASRIPFLIETRRMGFELGSHSVSHSKKFDKFPMGTALVTAATYQAAESPTVVGEVKVSKELLDRDLPGQKTVSFRAGELRYPRRLVEALELSGYQYDSTASANNIITNFPFFAFAAAHLGARETAIVEIPVTLDDSQGFLTAERQELVVQGWSEVIEANRANGATTCILIHPTNTTYKLAVLRRLLDRYAKQNVWIGSVAELGDFWATRAKMEFRAETTGDTLVLHLNQEMEKLSGDLSIVVSGNKRADRFEILDSKSKTVPYHLLERSGGKFLVLSPKK